MSRDLGPKVLGSQTRDEEAKCDDTRSISSTVHRGRKKTSSTNHEEITVWSCKEGQTSDHHNYMT
ncbi:unnamed protein product [Penicillium camemberti]|uniref:Str. FM013 n=1 Tax=Penicillium camemberti (strain FM 013) TaxID=1429867 RepID=A0A0G4P6W0_PENC3|nr:unnamed protein product [Penicillium camemberti]